MPSCRYRASPHGELPRRCQIPSARLQGVAPGSDSLWVEGGLDLPTTRSPLGLSTPAGFSPVALETPSRLLRSWPSPTRTRCLRDGWPPACQSATDLMIYPQITFPFELLDLSSELPEGNFSEVGPTCQAARYDRRTARCSALRVPGARPRQVGDSAYAARLASVQVSVTAVGKLRAGGARRANPAWVLRT